MADAGLPDQYQKAFQANQAWIKPGGSSVYNTPLQPDQERAFRGWVEQNKVPFQADAPITDYDMRGFWQALQAKDPRATSAIDPNDQRMHYPDYWKTPYHDTFSNESQWADPNLAPRWNDQDQLVSVDGKVLFDDKAQAASKLNDQADQNRETVKKMRAGGG